MAKPAFQPPVACRDVSRLSDHAESRPYLPIRFRPAAVRAGLQAEDSTAAVASCRAFEELN